MDFSVRVVGRSGVGNRREGSWRIGLDVDNIYIDIDNRGVVDDSIVRYRIVVDGDIWSWNDRAMARISIMRPPPGAFL